MNKLSVCRQVMETLKQQIKSPDFTRSYCLENRFVRKRKLTLEQVLLYLFYTSKASMNLNLLNIRDDVPEIAFPDVSKQAVSKARMAILPELFKEMFHFTGREFYHSGCLRKTWHGFHVFAVDGSSIQVPKTKDNEEYFGICRNQHHSREDAMAGISILYDVLEDIVADGSIQRYRRSERAAAREHLAYLETQKLTDKSIVIFDRGYPSYDFYNYFNEKGYFYLMRVQGKIKSLTATGKEDAVTEFLPIGRKSLSPVRVRVIHIPLDSGEDEFLVTNIMDPSITPDMFKELYFLRWGVESKFNELKNQIELEEFSGASHISVEQDFFIRLLFMNLCSFVKSEADQEISRQQGGAENKFQYQSNRALVIGRMKKWLVHLLSGSVDIGRKLEALFQEAIRKRSQIQPDRKCKRPRIQLRRRHCNNRKTTT